MAASVIYTSKVGLAILEALPDEDIDTSDIPEVTDWSDAIRGGVLSSSEKRKVGRISVA